MQQLYEDILTVIATVPEIRYADIDAGQIDIYENPPVSFPCALLAMDGDISFQRTSSRSELANINFNVRLAFVNRNTSDSLTPENIRENAVAYWDTLRSIRDAIISLSGTTRTRLTREKRTDHIVFNMQFNVVRHNLNI
jgi:hypothetical protein